MSTNAATAPPRLLDQALARAAAAAVRVAAVPPRTALSTLVAVQWLAVAALALTVRHDGWLYFQGGDQLWHYTSAWLLAHGKLPPTPISEGWATTLAPIAAAASPNLASALPAIVVLDTLVLLPIALLCVYGIGVRIGGRVFGYWTAALWIAMPFLGIVYTLSGYHQKYTELTLPQALGLTAMSDFPSIVLLLVAAYFVVRALERPAVVDGLAAGVAVGAAVLVKSSDALFIVALAAALLARRRWRELVAVAIGLAPELIALALWKQRGLGNLPAFALGQPVVREALPAAGVFAPVHHYVHFDWHHLYENLLGIQEHFWSVRVVELIPIAGAIGLARRSRSQALFVGLWFAVFLVAKGTYFDASMDDASFLRLLLPAAPAFVLLAAAAPLLVPRLGARIASCGREAPLPRPRRRVLVGAVAGVVAFALYPSALVAAASPINAPAPGAYTLGLTFVPVDPALRLRASLDGRRVLLRWPGQRFGATAVFYRLLRSRPDRDSKCDRVRSAPDACELTAPPLASPRATSFVDRPPRGRWTYRVGVTANWLDDRSQGDIFAVGPAVTVDVR